jgi:septal ring factor EnvC (AmiA/AmiB activator)
MIEKLTAELVSKTAWLERSRLDLGDARQVLTSTQQELEHSRSQRVALSQEKQELEARLSSRIEGVRELGGQIVVLEVKLYAKGEEVAQLKERIVKLDTLIVEFLLDKRKQG